MLLNKLRYRVQLYPAEASGTFKRNRFQPEFRDEVLASDVNVRRPAQVQGHKEKAIRTYSENSRHSTQFQSNYRLQPTTLSSFYA